VGQGLADGIHHLIGGAVLNGGAVDPGLHPQAVPQVAHLGGRHHRPQRAGPVGVLAQDPLRGELLRPARGRIVEARGADDRGQHLLGRGVDQPGADPSDDHTRREDLAVIRRNEPEPLVAVAAPIRGERDEVVAALSVIIPPGTIDPARVGRALRAGARAISRGLGSPRATAPPQVDQGPVSAP